MNNFFKILRPIIIFEFRRFNTNSIEGIQNLNKILSQINTHSTIEEHYNILTKIVQEDNQEKREEIKVNKTFLRLLTHVMKNIQVLSSTQISNFFDICSIMNFPCKDFTERITELICQGQLFPSSNLIKIIIIELFWKYATKNNIKILEIIKSELSIKVELSSQTLVL